MATDCRQKEGFAVEFERNAGLADRYWRITLGAVLLAVGAGRMARQCDWVAGTASVLGGMFIADGVLGTCPLYGPLGIDTREPVWERVAGTTRDAAGEMAGSLAAAMEQTADEIGEKF
jgi:hypothetical protein